MFFCRKVSCEIRLLIHKLFCCHAINTLWPSAYNVGTFFICCNYVFVTETRPWKQTCVFQWKQVDITGSVILYLMEISLEFYLLQNIIETIQMRLKAVISPQFYGPASVSSVLQHLSADISWHFSCHYRSYLKGLHSGRVGPGHLRSLQPSCRPRPVNCDRASFVESKALRAQRPRDDCYTLHWMEMRRLALSHAHTQKHALSDHGEHAQALRALKCMHPGTNPAFITAGTT